MAQAQVNEFRLKVGRTVLGLVCDSPEYAASLDAYFGRAPVDAPADIRLDLEIVNHRDDPEIPNSLFTTKTADGRDFDIADGLISGYFDPGRAGGLLRVKNVLTHGTLPRVFEQVLYQAYYSAQAVRGREDLLIHSAGVIVDGSGYLFVGASGRGKSTVAELSAHYLVINDEINCIEYREDGPHLAASPFNGFFKPKTEATAPLRGIFTLAHGTAHEVLDIGTAEAVSAIAAQIVPPVGLEQAVPRDIRMLMIDRAMRLCSGAPVRRLEFTPDAGFWDVIIRETEGKKES